MYDIANALGVSRQSVYKRFGSKLNTYQWALDSYLAAIHNNIFRVLGRKDEATLTVLIHVFEILISDAIDLVRNPHGKDVLTDALKSLRHSNHHWNTNNCSNNRTHDSLSISAFHDAKAYFLADSPGLSARCIPLPTMMQSEPARTASLGSPYL